MVLKNDAMALVILIIMNVDASEWCVWYEENNIQFVKH